MADDVLTQARTPTDAAIRAALKAPVQPDSPIYSMTGALLAAYAVDAPRILALAYREAARRASFCHPAAPSAIWDACRCAITDELEALATALEEGTPE